jgi:hypothetical protein
MGGWTTSASKIAPCSPANSKAPLASPSAPDTSAPCTSPSTPDARSTPATPRMHSQSRWSAANSQKDTSPVKTPSASASGWGRRKTAKPPWVRIAGVCADVSYLWIDRETEPSVYLNAAQMPPAEASISFPPMAIRSRLRQAPDKRWRRSIPAVPLDSVQTYQHYLNEALAGLTYVAAWLTVDAFVGLLARRHRNLRRHGQRRRRTHPRNRPAHGSRRKSGRDVEDGPAPRRAPHRNRRRRRRLLAAGMARLSANLLFGVSPNDPAIFASITVAVIAISLLVSWGPARRAASIDPMRALRTE